MNKQQIMATQQSIIPVILGACVPDGLEPRAGHWGKAAGGDTLLELVRQAARPGAAAGVLDPAPILVGSAAQCRGLAALLSPADARADVIEAQAAGGTCLGATLGCLRAVERRRDALVVLAAEPCAIPSDALAAALAAAAWDAELDFVVTLGLRPGRPAVCRYIIPGAFDYGNTLGVSSFRGAASSADATELVAAGALWPSGLYMFRARTFLGEVARLSPEVYSAAGAAWRGALVTSGYWSLDTDTCSRCPVLSVEEAVVEASPRVTVLPVEANDRPDVAPRSPCQEPLIVLPSPETTDAATTQLEASSSGEHATFTPA